MNIKSGIEYLEEEQSLGRGPKLHQANQNQRIAHLRDNEQSAKYWGKVAATIRMLKRITPQTEIIYTGFTD